MQGSSRCIQEVYKKHATMIEARKGGNLISTRTIFEWEGESHFLLLRLFYWYGKSAVESFCPPQFCLSPESNLRRPASRPATLQAIRVNIILVSS